MKILLFLLLLATSARAQLGGVYYQGELGFSYSQLFGPFNGSFHAEGAIDTSTWVPSLDEGLGGAIFATDTTGAQQLLTLAVKRDLPADSSWNVFGLLYRSPGVIGTGSVPNPTTTVNLFLLWHLDSLSLPDFTDSIDFMELLDSISAEAKLVGTATGMNITSLDATTLEYTFSGIMLDLEGGGFPILATGGSAQLSGFDVSVDEPRALRPGKAIWLAPNPFNPSTRVVYSLPRAGSARLDVHDLRGALVDRVMLGQRPAGPGEVVWQPRGAATGSYTLTLHLDGEPVTQTRALLLR
jgi:hypothetical protein